MSALTRNNNSGSNTKRQVGNLPTAVSASRYKTKVCQKFADTGSCPYETRCMFAHGLEEMRTAEMNRTDGLLTDEAIRGHQRKLKIEAAAAAASVAHKQHNLQVLQSQQWEEQQQQRVALELYSQQQQQQEITSQQQQQQEQQQQPEDCFILALNRMILNAQQNNSGAMNPSSLAVLSPYSPPSPMGHSVQSTSLGGLTSKSDSYRMPQQQVQGGIVTPLTASLPSGGPNGGGSLSSFPCVIPVAGDSDEVDSVFHDTSPHRAAAASANNSLGTTTPLLTPGNASLSVQASLSFDPNGAHNPYHHQLTVPPHHSSENPLPQPFTQEATQHQQLYQHRQQQVATSEYPQQQQPQPFPQQQQHRDIAAQQIQSQQLYQQQQQQQGWSSNQGYAHAYDPNAV